MYVWIRPESPWKKWRKDVVRSAVALAALFGLILLAGGRPAGAAGTQIDLTTQVMKILPTANGGTGIAYFTAAGPSTVRTYTFPDASTTVLTTNAAVTVAQGGTGVQTVTAHGVVLGEGTSAVNSPAASGNGQCFMSAAASYATTDPSFQACPGIPTFYQEVPSGPVNGGNASFTLANTPTSNASVILFLNGVALTQGSMADYTLSSATITFNTAPLSGAILLAQYH